MFSAASLVPRTKVGVALAVAVLVALQLLLFAYWEKRKTPGCSTNPFGEVLDLVVFGAGASAAASVACLLFAAAL